MERKAKVTQEIVNTACDELSKAGKNVTVSAVIGIAGGSFSTVGEMVKHWKEEQAKQAAPIVEMPETVSQAMQKATVDIWGAASALASETVERIQKEAGETITKAKSELAEYAGEVSRLEIELEGLNAQLNQAEQKLNDNNNKAVELTAQNTALNTRLDDRDKELERLLKNYEKMQAELILIAKEKHGTKPSTEVKK